MKLVAIGIEVTNFAATLGRMRRANVDLETFLLEDYKLKAQYLTNHLSRMWNRFNFFLTINSALFAFSANIFSATEEVTDVTRLSFQAGIAAGIALSALWYFFGATDNYLVEVYRKQIATAYYLLNLNGFQGKEVARNVYSYVGEVKEYFLDWENGQVQDKKLKNPRPLQWRFAPISATEMAVILPIVFIVGFIILYWLWIRIQSKAL
jgi:hypothetical protein